MTENLAKIRPYYKYELAELYNKSRRVVMTWVDEIREELELTGYQETQHIFTLKQTELIFEHLGHPVTEDEEIYSKKRALILPYTKSEIAQMYGVSIRTLISQIDSIPNELAKKIIMDGNNKDFFERKTDKKFFKTNEVKLIFEHLGHPCL